MSGAVDFGAARSSLKALHAATGGDLVSFAWDGLNLRVQVARPESGRRPLVMLFDSEADYRVASDELVARFVAEVNQWFAGGEGQ